MTLGRWFGPGLIDRHGRVLTVRIFAALALVGLALVVWGSSLPGRHGGRGAVGARHGARLPGGDERGGRRPGARRRRG